MEASVTSPSGMTESCDIQDLGNSHYSIKFVPKEMGIHTVSVKHRGMHIPGMYCNTMCHLFVENVMFIYNMIVICVEHMISMCNV